MNEIGVLLIITIFIVIVIISIIKPGSTYSIENNTNDNKNKKDIKGNDGVAQEKTLENEKKQSEEIKEDINEDMIIKEKELENESENESENLSEIDKSINDTSVMDKSGKRVIPVKCTIKRRKKNSKKKNS